MQRLPRTALAEVGASFGDRARNRPPRHLRRGDGRCRQRGDRGPSSGDIGREHGPVVARHLPCMYTMCAYWLGKCTARARVCVYAGRVGGGVRLGALRDSNLRAHRRTEQAEYHDGVDDGVEVALLAQRSGQLHLGPLYRPLTLGTWTWRNTATATPRLRFTYTLGRVLGLRTDRALLPALSRPRRVLGYYTPRCFQVNT